MTETTETTKTHIFQDLMDCIAEPKVTRVERATYSLALDYLTRCDRDGLDPAKNLADFIGVLGMKLEEAFVVALNRAFEPRKSLNDWEKSGSLRLTPGRRDIWDFFNKEEEEEDEYGAEGGGSEVGDGY